MMLFLSHLSLWVVPVHQPQASSIVLHTLKSHEKIISPYLSSSNLFHDKSRGEEGVLVRSHTET